MGLASPKRIGALQMTRLFARVGVQSVHTVLPLWDRRFLFASSEPRPPKGAPYKDFCA